VGPNFYFRNSSFDFPLRYFNVPRRSLFSQDLDRQSDQNMYVRLADNAKTTQPNAVVTA